MKTLVTLLVIAIPLSFAAVSLGQATTATIPDGMVTLRVDFKSQGDSPKNRTATPWDGSVTVSEGSVREIRLWQEDARNSVDGTSWTLTTRRRIPWNSRERAKGHQAMPLKDGAIMIELVDTSPSSVVGFETVQGNFKLSLRDVPFGSPETFLRGMVRVSRSANTAIVLSAPTEDDYPSAVAGPNGELHVAYVAFTHGEDFQKKMTVPEPIMGKSFDVLTQPVGGDQVLLMTKRGDKWTGPEAVTPTGQDVYRTAVAVDGAGRVWVFWSANRDDNWDIYARSRQENRWSNEIRLTADPGPDAFPVATTDSEGRVWLAWQAFRDGEADIHAVVQQGKSFAEPVVVTDAPGNQWSPAVAASSDSQVAIAWDSYETGSYDVYARLWSGDRSGRVVPIAATRKAEMRASVTFDKLGRLWIAYEEAPELWGKDSGPTDRGDAVGLYRNRDVRVRVLDGSKLSQTADVPSYAFEPGKRAKGELPTDPKLGVPRLTTDSAGRVWLAVRSPKDGSRTNVGTAWFEHLLCYSGEMWSDQIACPRTDNILDNRPALVPLASGAVAMIGSTDGRYTSGSRLPEWFVKTLRKEGEKIEQKKVESRWPDPVNNELMMAEVGPMPSEAGPVKLVPVDDGEVKPEATVRKEREDVARARAAQAVVGAKTYRLVRGEFHRHTEISSDGGGDGLLMDMWRYAIDAAAMDWIGNGDHDNGGGRDYSWWICQKTTHLLQLPGAFTPMYSYERSCGYPDGHRNVVFSRRGIRTLPRLDNGKGKAMDALPADVARPNTPDTLMLYDYLRHFDGVCASHTSGTDMGTDWRDNDSVVEPIVEIFQGCRQSYEMPGAPRSNTAENSIGGWRPLGFVSLALKKGYRLGFQSSSDHGSTHISYCNVWVEEHTREAILDSMKARHIYGATDNIVAVVTCGSQFMGDEFTTAERPKLNIRLTGTAAFDKVHVIKDGNYVHSASPGQPEVEIEWTDFAAKPGATAYYYVRGEQEDGELVWVSPMWITYKP